MDYTKVPRSLIYKDREDLNDFGVQTQGTLNNYLFTQMRRMTLLRCGDAKEIALQCFNNAFYICTLIELEEFPDLCMDKYEAILLPEMIPFPEDVYQASMALVCVFLAAYDDKYKQKDDPLIESIYHWTSSNKWVGSCSRKSFEDIINKCSPDGFFLAPDTFAPRDIIEVRERSNIDTLVFEKEYICERLALMDDARRKMYGADLIISQLKDNLHEIYEKSNYNPMTSKYEYAGNFIRGLDVEQKIDLRRKAIEYYKEHYPNEEMINSKEQSTDTPQTPSAEALLTKTVKLESRLKYLEEQLKEANDTNVQQASNNNELIANISNLKRDLQEAHQIIEEYRQPVKKLTAKQKIRMEFAVQLFLNAGLTEEKLGSNKTKVASLLSLLLDIRSENGRNRPEQICSNFLTDRKYYPQTQDKDTILELDRLCAELNINAFLSTAPQGNKKG